MFYVIHGSGARSFCLSSSLFTAILVFFSSLDLSGLGLSLRLFSVVFDPLCFSLLLLESLWWPLSFSEMRLELDSFSVDLPCNLGSFFSPCLRSFVRRLSPSCFPVLWPPEGFVSRLPLVSVLGLASLEFVFLRSDLPVCREVLVRSFDEVPPALALGFPFCELQEVLNNYHTRMITWAYIIMYTVVN